MRTRPLAKLATAVATGAALIGLMGFPASATTGPVSLTGGTLDIYDSSFNLLTSQALGTGLNHDCNPAGGTATATDTAPLNDGNGTLSSTLTSDSVVDIFNDGNYFRVELEIDLAGTYTGSGSSVTLAGDATTVIRSVASSTSCTPTGSVNCTVSAGNISVTGASEDQTTGNPSLPTVANSITTVNGGNTLGDNVTTGTCGALIAINNGYADLIGATIEG